MTPPAQRLLRLSGLLSVLLAFPLAFPLAALADAHGSVEGRVVLDLEGADLSALGPVVVYLDRVDAAPPEPRPLPVATIVQRNARFVPAFQVVTVGQTVQMPNADAIYHNVFSYSRPNDFDLGIYPAGESRTVVFRHPGVVKTYCSIHESMNATIVVVPSRLYDLAGPTGRFEIEDVPPGRYRLRVWSEKLPETRRDITVAAGRPASLDLPLVPSPG